MSTKIYEAYKLAPDVTLNELMIMLQQLRKEYLQKCAEFVDRTKGDKGFAEISNELRKDLSTMERTSYNFNASVVVYSFEDKTYVQLFGLDFTEGDAYEKLKSFLTDYHYQDQCDEWWCYEEGHTEIQIAEFERDYEERKRVWKGIYGDSWKPSECGLVFEVCAKEDYHVIAGKVFNLW